MCGFDESGTRRHTLGASRETGGSLEPPARRGGFIGDEGGAATPAALMWGSCVLYIYAGSSSGVGEVEELLLLLLVSFLPTESLLFLVLAGWSNRARGAPLDSVRAGAFQDMVVSTRLAIAQSQLMMFSHLFCV